MPCVPDMLWRFEYRGTRGRGIRKILAILHLLESSSGASRLLVGRSFGRMCRDLAIGIK